MQGLFNIILGISSNAQVLILDEPFDGLDVIVKKQVMKLLLNEISLAQKSLLISSHNLIELETLLDRALILKNGKIVNEYHLEEVKGSMKKVQMVFKDKRIPEVIKKNAEILSVQGRVVVGLFKEITPVLKEEINRIEPVLFEEIPITLEDLFSANLTDEQDFQLFN
ncbi:ABC transporter ATP-binding protein [Vagococcus carniphilus]|uniref:ABC transporter ATP-binding protein n=1 Tax=Vagococcus carniphilus TaxID=218144 RepID=UPI003B5C99B8